MRRLSSPPGAFGCQRVDGSMLLESHRITSRCKTAVADIRYVWKWKEGGGRRTEDREKTSHGNRPDAPISFAIPPFPPGFAAQFLTTTNAATATSSALALASSLSGSSVGSIAHFPSELMYLCGRPMSKAPVLRMPKLSWVVLTPRKRMASVQESTLRSWPKASPLQT